MGVYTLGYSFVADSAQNLVYCSNGLLVLNYIAVFG